MLANHPTASVILCTRNRAPALERCLQSLDRDTSATIAEVVIVDNGSADATRTVVEAAIERSSRPMRMVSEPSAGLSHARNTGVRAAEADLLLFTDDDVVIHDGWIDALVAAFEPGVVAVGGRVIPKFPDGRPAWATDARNFLTLNDEGAAPFEMTGEVLPTGANMALRRSGLTAGEEPFELELGSASSPSGGGEDMYLMHRLLGRGRIMYAPTAVVDHPFEPYRLTSEYGRRRSYLAGISYARLCTLGMVDEPEAPFPRRALRVLGAARHLASVRWRNSRQRADGTAVQDEFDAYHSLGRFLEQFSPTLARWGARALVG